jgi:hypothetical protein
MWVFVLVLGVRDEFNATARRGGAHCGSYWHGMYSFNSHCSSADLLLISFACRQGLSDLASSTCSFSADESLFSK